MAAFADALRGGKYLDGYGCTQIAALPNGARGDDASGYRAGFVQLVKLATGWPRTVMPTTTPRRVEVSGPLRGPRL